MSDGRSSGSGAVLVTGASGFVGRHVVAQLAGAMPVKAGIHRTALPDDLAAMPSVAAVPCRLGNPDELAAALTGSDHVVHAGYGGDPAAMVADARRLCAAAIEAGVRTIVTLSSIDVYGSRDGPVRESDTPVPPIGSYGAAKRDVEDILRGFAEDDRRAVALRVGCVLGKGRALWVDGMCERMRAGVLGHMGEAGSGNAPLVDAADVAAAVAKAIEVAPDGFSAFNIEGGYSVTWNAYFAMLASAAAIPLPTFDAGAAKRHAILSVPAKAWRKARLPGFGRMAMAPRGGELSLFSRKATYAIDEASKVLGWTPSVSLKDALAKAVHA
ncbi:MAG: NAD(P)-dependent oxidoreductase [Pseudomonadota bacterium]